MDDHAIAVRILTALADIFFRNVRSEMHGGRVVPEEERLVGFGLFLHPRQRALGDLFVHRLHALLRQRTRIFNRLLADAPPARVDGRIVCVGRLAMEHAARPKHFLKLGVLRVVGQFRLFFGIEMVEIAEEFIEAVHRRQKLVAVAEVVLPELAGGVALRFEQFGDGRVFVSQPQCSAGQADLGEAGS